MAKPTHTSKNKRFALCIGINDYPGTGSDLRGCVNDANDWAKALGQRGYDVTRVLNKDASRKALRQSIRELIARGASGDSLVITFSGHGSYVPDDDGDEPDGTDEVICPYDVDTAGAITDDELFELYSQRKHGVRVVMISDSCHSGSVARYAAITTPPTIAGRDAPQRKTRFLPPATFLARKHLAKLGTRRAARSSSPPGRYAALLLAGCQDTEVSWDASFQGRPNGAFSFVALRELATLPEKASYRAWFERIRKRLPSQQYPQTPNLFGSSAMKSWRTLSDAG